MSSTGEAVSLDGTGRPNAGVLRDGTFVSLSELRARSLRAAAGLRALGVGRGDVIAILMRNDHEYFEAAFAATALGAVAVPINWHGSAEEVAYVVSDSEAKVLIGHADLLHGLGRAISRDVTVLGVETPRSIAAAYDIPSSSTTLPDDVLEWGTWRDGFAAIGDADSNDPGTMIYTSGTTGRPKGVRRLMGTSDPAAVSAYYRDAFHVFGLWPQMRTVITGPMYHSAPYTYSLTAARLMEGFIVLQERFEPEALLALIEQHRITSLYMVPTMFVRLLRLPPAVRQRYDLSSLVNVSHTAAPCPPEVKRALMEWLGPIVSEFYGSTEAGLVAGCTGEEWLTHPGTVGRPLASCTIQIVENDGLAPVGQPGEIYVRAAGITDFTYQGKPESRAEIERDGLVTCGDVGYLDDDGYLYICDRVRDMIISGGVNIYPAEIEACLMQLDGIADCAVFGVPDDEFGESVAAAVQVLPGATLTERDIQEHVRAHLASFKTPRLIEFHEKLPREDTGKMFKRKLRAPHWEHVGRSI